MKKVIVIVAVVIIAVLGLTSYNTNEVKRNESNSTLLSSLNNGGTGLGSQIGSGGGTKTDGDGNKKLN